MYFYRICYLVGVFGCELKRNIIVIEIKIIDKEIFCLEVVGFCYDFGLYMFFDFLILYD